MKQSESAVPELQTSMSGGTVQRKPAVVEHAAVLDAIDGYDTELRAINKKVCHIDTPDTKNTSN